MFLQFVLTGIGGILILAACEYLIKLKAIKGEYARKIVHIVISVYAATWAFYLSYQLIILISLILIAAVFVVKAFPMLRSLRPVKRVTYGEIYFAIAIGLSALLFREPAIYAIAILHMGLADGFAAVVGVGMGRKAKKFTYNGSKKSIEGTLTFLAISFFLNATYWLYLSGKDLSLNGIDPLVIPLYSVVCAITLAVAEIVSPRGSDNVIIPLLSGFLLWAPIALFGSASVLL